MEVIIINYIINKYPTIGLPEPGAVQPTGVQPQPGAANLREGFQSAQLCDLLQIHWQTAFPERRRPRKRFRIPSKLLLPSEQFLPKDPKLRCSPRRRRRRPQKQHL